MVLGLYNLGFNRLVLTGSALIVDVGSLSSGPCLAVNVLLDYVIVGFVV
jgi:hypothetical protein